MGQVLHRPDELPEESPHLGGQVGHTRIVARAVVEWFDEADVVQPVASSARALSSVLVDVVHEHAGGGEIAIESGAIAVFNQ